MGNTNDNLHNNKNSFLILKQTDRSMITSTVWTDDHKLLQELYLTL